MVFALLEMHGNHVDRLMAAMRSDVVASVAANDGHCRNRVTFFAFICQRIDSLTPRMRGA